MAKNFVDIRDDEKFYYQAMRKTIVQFLDLFDGIVIGRYDTESGILLKYVNVPFKFAPKMKHWYWSEKIDRDTGRRVRDKVLPMIACNMTNVEHASDRKVNARYRARTRTKENNNIERFFNPVPYNYTFDVQIAAEYMIDIIQIMERILPFFDSHLFIRLVIPELDIVPDDIKDGAHPLDIKVIYEGSSIDDTIQFDETDHRVLIRTLNFKVEGYLFKPKYTYPIIRRTFEEFKTSINDDAFLTLTTYGLSAEKYPLSVSGEDMEDARYDDDIKLLYKYERE
jgi:hypothetical protein